MIIKPKWLRNAIAIIVGYLSVSVITLVFSMEWNPSIVLYPITIIIFSFASFLLSLFGLLTGN